MKEANNQADVVQKTNVYKKTISPTEVCSKTKVKHYLVAVVLVCRGCDSSVAKA